MSKKSNNYKVIDMHCDTVLRLMYSNEPLLKTEGHLDLERMKKGNYALQCFAMFVHYKKVERPFEYVNKMIDKYYQEISKNMDIIRPVFSYQDIENNMKNGFMSSMLTIEEGGVTQGNLAFLRNLYLLGVRMITLTWNFENGIGFPNFKEVEEGKPDMHTPNTEDGLTEYGIEMVKEMEKLGIIIDVSHLSDKGFYDVLENTTKPFVASHSNARSVCPVVRNMTDDMILKLAKRGGVMGINYCADFVNDVEENNFAYVKDMVKHIKYIKDLAGIDCIGLGSDFDGIGSNIEMNSCDKLNLLQEALEDEGFTQEEIEKIFYKNVLRVFKEVLI